MASIRKKLTENVNDSKNTRMDIANANLLGNWRPDEITHMTRYDKISSLCIDEAKKFRRPIDTLEVGCGEIWVLRNLFKNFSGRLDIQDLTVNPKFDVEDESIDFFWTTEVIEHMKPEFIRPWLEDAHRVLRPGGLVYVSTPNHDGSNDKLPEDHVYEWGFRELHDELTRNWELDIVVGTFCQMPRLRKAMQKDYREEGEMRWSEDQFDILKARFGKQFLRVFAATFYPEISNNCAWILRKPK